MNHLALEIPSHVAPFTGAWIEINLSTSSEITTLSLPSRGRGLKFIARHGMTFREAVAPFTGAWIEIEQLWGNTDSLARRSLHGGVD